MADRMTVIGCSCGQAARWWCGRAGRPWCDDCVRRGCQVPHGADCARELQVLPDFEGDGG